MNYDLSTLTPHQLTELNTRFWAKVNKSGPVVRDGLTNCWEWTAQLNNHGYGCFRMSNPRGMIYAHRLSYMLLKGPLGKNIVLHECDNTKCVRHLFLGDHGTNSRDAAIKRRTNTAILTVEQVEILKLNVDGRHTLGATNKYSKEFGVHRSTIRRAIKGITFRPV